MTGNDLIKFIQENRLENSNIYIGVQGYSSEYNSDDNIHVDIIGNDLLIHDNCYYDSLVRG